MNCLICNTEQEVTILKQSAFGSARYGRCYNCGTISTADYITDMIKTHNDCNEIRNTLPNNVLRMCRIDEALKRKPDFVLDFGCGSGELVTNMTTAGINAIGIDQHNISDMELMEPGSFDAITMIEVIEHLYNSAETLKKLSALLKPGGVLMIETTFADDIKDLGGHPYVSPEIGHVCILSRGALMRVVPPDLAVDRFVNPNVVILRKGTWSS